PDSPNDSVREIKPPESVGRKTGEKYSSSPQQARHHRDDSRTFTFHPQAANNSAASQKKPANQEYPSDLCNAPAEFLGERDAKDAPCVGRAESHLHAYASNGNPPTIHSRHGSSNGVSAHNSMTKSPAGMQYFSCSVDVCKRLFHGNAG